MGKLVTTVKPTAPPVTLVDAKEHLRVLDDTHDSRIGGYVWDAAASIEILTGCRLAEQTVRLDLDGFPSGDIDLEIYPVTAITSIAYDDADGVAQTLTLDTGASPAGDYWQNLAGMYPYITPYDAWPATQDRKPASVRITMTVGYTTIPHDLRHAVLLRVSEYFNNSAESVTGTEVFASLSTVKALTDMHRRIK